MTMISTGKSIYTSVLIAHLQDVISNAKGNGFKSQGKHLNSL